MLGLSRDLVEHRLPIKKGFKPHQQRLRHSVITFMDGQSSYNQIFMTTEDVHKMTFHCPRALGIYEWLVMSFELKNVGATNQRAMNLIPHDAVRKNMQVYIDDVVVKLVA